jgi:NodT family efflux transporter outer membrane factor (OMF) lipoprotein
MNTKFLRHLLFLSLMASAWGSCKVTKTYQTPDLRTDNLYRNVTPTDTTSLATLNWREVFTDTALQALITQGIAENPDLKIAYTRIQQAQAYYLQSRAAFLPSLNANAGVTESKLSKAQGISIRTHATQYQLGVSSVWEVDIWGRLSSNRRASLASLLQSEAAARAVQTGLVASIATYYYSLLALDRQLLITGQTVRNWDTTVQTMQALKEAASVTAAAVVQSEAQRYAAEVTIPDLKQRIRETENALSILLGRAPAGINRSSIESQVPPQVLHTGVPAQLLANRPDVQEAELNFRYAFELTNVARTYFYPSLTINGSAALSSLALNNFFSPNALAASIGAGLIQPIFNQRAGRTRLAVAKSQQQGALFNFQNTLLTAGREVSDALSLYETAVEKMSVRTNQLTALKRSVEYSQELLRNGFANYIEVINARQSLLQAELGSINDRLQQLQALVDLYRSLGGGWK